MCRPINTQELLSSKQNLIELLGGKDQIDFLLINFCESIKEDTNLRMLFKHINVDQLTSIMGDLIKAAFEANLFDVKARNGVVMKNYALFELGIDSNGFKKIKDHFEFALHSCWIEEGLIEDCILRFGALQSIFESEGAELRKTACAQRASASRFQAAPAAA